MITTKQGNPVIQVECERCKGKTFNVQTYSKKKCFKCNGTGQKTVEIPKEYHKEIDILLKVKKPSMDALMKKYNYGYDTIRRFYVNERDDYERAQQRLIEIETTILKG